MYLFANCIAFVSHGFSYNVLPSQYHDSNFGTQRVKWYAYVTENRLFSEDFRN